jgi:uncharacterized protein (TIRG00374 family)
MVSPRARMLLALGLGALLLGALIAYVGPASVLDALLRASPLHLALAAVCYAFFFLLRGLRWRTLLSRSAPDVRLSGTTSVTAVGWLANSILPLKGGDVLRAALLAKREGLGAGHAAASVALERVLDLVGLALVATIALLLIPTDVVPFWMARAIEVAWILPLVAIVALALFVVFRAPAMRLAGAVCKPFGRFGQKLYEFTDTAVSGVATLSRHPRLLAILLPQTILVSLAQAMIFALLAMAFLPGLPLGLAFGGAAVFMLSFVVSVTPGNVGTYETAFGAVFAALGAAFDEALAAAILTHLTTTLLVAILGSVGMLVIGATPGAPRPARVSGLPGGGKA